MALSIAKPHSFTDCLVVPNLALETSHLFSDPGFALKRPKKGGGGGVIQGLGWGFAYYV